MPLPTDPAGRHRAIADTFTERVRGVSDWDAPAPVEGWAARDVVRHLVEWFPGFLEGGAGITLPAVPSVDDDPVGAWTAHADNVQALLDDPATETKVLSNPHMGDVPLPQAIDQFYTADIFMHTWDLSRASGQPDRLDADFANQLFSGMEQYDEMLRSSGQYGPRVPVPDSADITDKLVGFIGRDPSWTPPA
ncbi:MULTISPECIES: TIGR03086 family metal-binding protein [unclassified Knoellia]|uniref:TIGR03086 family metal-binding protein n=1 Tax=Knoellia altitudinis TaxID=3404795 RepID=UPI00361CE20B